MFITARSFATTQRLHSHKFTLVDKTVLSSARLIMARFSLLLVLAVVIEMKECHQ